MNGDDNKIKAGDTVKLKSGVICCGLNPMTQYLIERVRCKSVVLKGKDGAYDESIFIKVKSNLELSGEILSPLQAAEAIINKEKLQVFDTDMNNWFGFHRDLRDIALEDLKHIKLRHKPKTILINGVEVAAPVELPRYTEGYTPSLCHREVQTASAGKGRIMWATKEDAQKALDAMLIPFNNLNKG